MKVIIDTCIWSLALRRQKHASINPEAKELEELIKEVRTQLIGSVRQEILSGIKEKSQFNRLKKVLRFFPDLPLACEDFELAAEYYNLLRSKGIQGSNTDFLICAISVRYDMPIFTTDNDFYYFKQHIPILIYKPRTT